MSTIPPRSYSNRISNHKLYQAVTSFSILPGANQMGNLHKHNSFRDSMTPLAWSYRTMLRSVALTRITVAFNWVTQTRPEQVEVNAIVKHRYRKRWLRNSQLTF